MKGDQKAQSGGVDEGQPATVELDVPGRAGEPVPQPGHRRHVELADQAQHMRTNADKPERHLHTTAANSIASGT